MPRPEKSRIRLAILPVAAIAGGGMLIYGGWQREPGREEMLVLGFMALLAGLGLAAIRFRG